jgi:RNA polymerase sigma factor for flagellar operon FliA
MESAPSIPHTSASPSRDELASFMPLVRKEVARMMSRVPPNILRDDLVAAGSSGLCDALRRSPGRGPAFAWYARVRIRGAVVDELRSQDWLNRGARARATRACEEGSTGSRTVVGFDDLPPSQAEGLVDAAAPSPFDLVERRTERAMLDRAVALLPEREAGIIASHYFDDVSLKIIAGRLGVSEPRVSQLHARAIGRLKTSLSTTRSAESAASVA